MNGREATAVARVITSGWVTQGPEVAAFESEFAHYVGAKYACAVSSCTAALHLGLLALGVGPRDEVITVSHSFIATANSIRHCGAIPIFIDIDPATFNINPGLIERAITRRTRAILCVHQMGMPCDLKAILEVARRHHLPVIEDAACALGSELLVKGRPEKIGKPHADIACFSFHPRKVITTGDGGMITTSSSGLDKKVRLLRQHGMDRTASARHKSKKVIFESYPILGYNYRMTDLQAAVGREQLKRMPQIIKRRRFLAKRYNKMLQKIPGLKLPEEPRWAHANRQSYPVRLGRRYNQRRVMQFMAERAVATKRGIMCAHLERTYGGKPRRNLKESEDARNQCITLPLFPGMTESEQIRVVKTLFEACKRSGTS